MLQELSPYLALVGALVGPFALLWNISSWWNDRRPLPVLDVKYALNQSGEGTICSIFLTVKNRGKRSLYLSGAMVWILRGFLPNDTSARIEFINPNDISNNKEVDELIKAKRVVRVELLPQMTKETESFVEPEDALSEIIPVRIFEPGVYKVVFQVQVDRFPLPWRPKELIYHDVDLFVVNVPEVL